MTKHQNSVSYGSLVQRLLFIVIAFAVTISFTLPASTYAQANNYKSAAESCPAKDTAAVVVDACKRGYENALEGKSADEACEAFTAEKATACEIGAVEGVNAKNKGAKPASEKKASNPDCDVQLTNPLSWIICPIVDLGANFTDFVFTTFVRGLLSDVPISTQAGDGTFEAWKQFRTLGNIVLLGTLLAVVYSQARSK